jgi:hypothetical protein
LSRRAFAYFALLPLALAACSTSPSDARIGIDTPDESTPQWDPVSDLLDYRCGSLDCHGNMQRNLVIWGCNGLRLEPPDAGPDASTFIVPGCRNAGGTNTVQAEYDATYRSLVGLEPTVMSTVVADAMNDAGLHPELLTFIRKARGWDAHKGGQIWTAGDPSDTCVTSWLGGATSMTDCAMGLACDAVVCPVDAGATGP